MTFSAILCLAILRDDFSLLDREGLSKFLTRMQQKDGRYVLNRSFLFMPTLLNTYLQFNSVDLVSPRTRTLQSTIYELHTVLL